MPFKKGNKERYKAVEITFSSMRKKPKTLTEMGLKALNINIKKEYHDMLRKMAANRDISITEIISRYLEFLYAKHYTQRKEFNGKPQNEFDMDSDN